MSMPLEAPPLDTAAVWIQARTRGVLSRRQRDQDAALRATVNAARLKRKSAIEKKYTTELATELTRKTESKAGDKTTIRKDGLLCAIALCGIAGQVVDAVWMLKLPQSYAWCGPPLRICLSLLAGLLIFRLADYYAYLFEAQRLQLPPAYVSFLQVLFLPWLYTYSTDLPSHTGVLYTMATLASYTRLLLKVPGLRRGFALEAFVALLHAPPTGLPPTHLPRPGECRLAGYAPENANPKSLDRCVAVYASIFGMLVFVRLHLARTPPAPQTPTPTRTRALIRCGSTCCCACCATRRQCGGTARASRPPAPNDSCTFPPSACAPPPCGTSISAR